MYSIDEKFSKLAISDKEKKKLKIQLYGSLFTVSDSERFLKHTLDDVFQSAKSQVHLEAIIKRYTGTSLFATTYLECIKDTTFILFKTPTDEEFFKEWNKLTDDLENFINNKEDL